MQARSERLRARYRLMRSIRAFFDARDFTEVETPALVPSPGVELHVEALEVMGMRQRRWLSPSPEFAMKRLLAIGLSPIFQLCRCFRRDELGGLHQPEFTMLEWYRANAGSAAVMQDTETLVAQLAGELADGSPSILRHGKRIDLTPPWERLSVRDAFARYASVPLDEVVDDDDAFYRTLIDDIEPQLGKQRPVFLTRYPARMASLARLCPDDPTVADRFEAYVDGIELCNGFGELTDAVEQRRRFETDLAARARLGRPAYPIDEDFLAALASGLPDSGGNALGIDRLLMLLLGAERIDDVIAFPEEQS